MVQQFLSTPGGNLFPDPDTSYDQSEAFRVVAHNRDNKDRAIGSSIDDAKAGAISDADQKYGGLPAEINAIKNRELPNRGRLRPADYPDGLLSIDKMGTYAVWTGNDAITLGLPVTAASKVDVYEFGASLIFEVVSFPSGGISKHIRRASSREWITDWERQTVSDDQVAELVRNDTFTRREILDIVGGDSTPGGTRVVPLSLTVGASTVEAPTQGTARYPVHFSPVIERWRLHIVDVNPRYGSSRTGTSALQSVLIGAHAGDGAFAVKPTLIAEAGTVSPGATGWTSEWMDHPVGASNQLLSFAYTTVDGAPTALSGAGWQGDISSAQEMAPSFVAPSTRMPFHVWIEAEVNKNIRIIAGLGSSSACGVGADRPVLDSFVSQHARRVGALPVHYTASGTRIEDWNYPTHHKWVMWDGYTAPDALIWNIGSNNVYGDTTFDQMIAESDDLLGLLRDRGIQYFYAASIPPRATTSPEQNTVRQDYNEWMRISGEFLDVFDFSAALSDDDLTMLPEFDSGDGIHYNTAGHNATVETITNNMATVPLAP